MLPSLNLGKSLRMTQKVCKANYILPNLYVCSEMKKKNPKKSKEEIKILLYHNELN